MKVNKGQKRKGRDVYTEEICMENDTGRKRNNTDRFFSGNSLRDFHTPNGVYIKKTSDQYNII